MKFQMTDLFKKRITDYLEKRAAEDKLFAEAYNKPEKSIKECLNYIIGEARKLGSAVVMDDAEVFGLAVHYYDEDDIKVNRLAAGTRAKVSASPPVVLTEEEKAKLKEDAEKRYTSWVLEKMRDEQEAKKKAAEKARRDEAKKAQEAEMSLF